jgi:hypothetical protein
VRRGTLILALVTAPALLLGLLVVLHVPGVTGPAFWRWAWRRLPAWPLYGFMAAALAPFVVGQLMYLPGHRARTWLAIGAAMLSCFALKLASVAPHTDPPSLRLIDTIVRNPLATSYFTDAAALNSRATVREWLAAYDQIMPQLSLHSQTKPPGAILYWTTFIKLFGVSDAATRAGGLVLGLLATISVPATFLLIKRLTGDVDAAVAGASLMSLCPGFVLFFPMFDPAYAILSCAMIGLWALAVEREDWRAALALGAVLALACWVSFNVLVVGTFMAAYPLVVPRVGVERAVRLGTIALMTAVLVLTVTFALTGYDPLATFASAWRNQHALLARYGHMRPYPLTIPFDLADFAFGAAWSGAALAVAFVVDRSAWGEARRVRLSLLCLAQLVLVAITGLLQMETARVWNFMLPLLMVPAGLELRTWSPRWRMLVYGATWFATAAIAQNVKLIY